MPREIVHWLVLERCTERLSESDATAAATALKTHRSAAYLGAIAHDAPYYYRLGADHAFSQIAEAIHGRFGQDTFEPIRTMAADILHSPDSERGALWAFLLGMVSHYAADIVFHP